MLLFRIFFILTYFLIIPHSFAKLVELKITNYGSSDPKITKIIDDFLNDIENKIDNQSSSKDIQIPQIGKFLKGIGEANAISTKGAGPFYAQNFKYFGFGLGVSLGADFGNQPFGNILSNNFNSNEFSGASFNPVLTLGFKSANPDKNITYIINGVYFDNNKFSKNGIHSKHVVASVLVQQKIVDPIVTPLEFIYWSGVDLGIGVNHAYLDLSFSKQFTTSITKKISLPTLPSAGNNDVTAVVLGPYTLGVKSTTYAIPCEFSTGYQLAKFFTQYAGLALDLNLGTAETYAYASPDIEFHGSNPLLVLPTVKTQVNFLANQKKSINLFNLRYFTGLTLALGPLGLFFNFNKTFLINAFSLTLGIKVMM